MKKLFIASALAGLAFGAADTALAATLANVQGQVLVNGAPGTEGQTLAAGDLVTVGELGGQASVVLAEGCSLPAQPGQVVSVPAAFDCAAPPAAGGGGTGMSTSILTTGLGVLAGAGVGYAIGDDDDDNDRPASP